MISTLVRRPSRFVSLLIVLAYAQVSFAVEIPKLVNNLICAGEDRQALPFVNEKVFSWKQSIPNGGKKRALVQGVVTDIYPSKQKGNGKSHTHFAIDLDQRSGGDLEVIFNDQFGDLPNITIGMKVVACGVYITANQKSDRPSPMDAIIHWVHYNPGDRDNGKHPDGFVIINNKPYGFTTPPGNTPYRGPRNSGAPQGNRSWNN